MMAHIFGLHLPLVDAYVLIEACTSCLGCLHTFLRCDAHWKFHVIVAVVLANLSIVGNYCGTKDHSQPSFPELAWFMQQYRGLKL